MHITRVREETHRLMWFGSLQLWGSDNLSLRNWKQLIDLDWSSISSWALRKERKFVFGQKKIQQILKEKLKKKEKTELTPGSKWLEGKWIHHWKNLVERNLLASPFYSSIHQAKRYWMCPISSWIGQTFHSLDCSDNSCPCLLCLAAS